MKQISYLCPKRSEMNDFPFCPKPGNTFQGTLLDKLKPLMHEVSYPKGAIFLDNAKVERNLYIIKKGVARAFVNVDGREVTIWLGMENDVVISMQGYVYGKKGYEVIELLEDSSLYQIDQEQLMALYETDIEVCNWGRQLIEREYIETEQRLIYNLSVSATERYLHLLKRKPGLLKRVQLQYIASYLGISSESLSRIRNQTKHLETHPKDFSNQ